VTRRLHFACLLAAALLPAFAALASGQHEPPRRELPPGSSQAPRPERIVPPPQQEIVPPRAQTTRPEIRAGIEQRPVGSERVRVTVRVIAAEPGSAGKDPRLSAVESNLDTLPLRYGSYKLLDEQTFELDWKAGAQMELPGSRALLVTPRQLGADGRIHVHLEVLGAHPEHARKLHTDYSIARGGTLLVGGYRLDPSRPEAGVLLIAITQIVR
jgi:hypothetical protein